MQYQQYSISINTVGYKHISTSISNLVLLASAPVGAWIGLVERIC